MKPGPETETARDPPGRDPPAPGRQCLAERRRAAGWRLACIVSASLAVAALLVTLRISMPGPPGTAVAPRPVPAPAADIEGIASFALLVEDDGTARWVVEVTQTQQKLARPIGTPQTPEGRVYQLWLVEAETILPVAVLDTARGISIDLPDTLTRHAVFIVSVEPPGGSPTGLPTGTVVMTGVPRP